MISGGVEIRKRVESADALAGELGPLSLIVRLGAGTGGLVRWGPACACVHV